MFSYTKKAIDDYCEATRNQIQRLQVELAKMNEKLKTLTAHRDHILALMIGTKNAGYRWKAMAQRLKSEFVGVTTQLQLETTLVNCVWRRLQLELEQTRLLVDYQPSTDTFESLWKLKKENKLTDFSLMVEGKSIQVHKNLLAVKSKFFAQQFDEHPEKLEYSIEGTTLAAVEQMVEFVYLGDAENFDEHLNELYKLSVRFHIDALKEKCVKLLESKLTIETSPEVFILATKNKDEKLSQIVIEYTEKNGGNAQPAVPKDFSALPENDVKSLTEIFDVLRL